MTAARSCWKRLHTDLEDSDECLPISKRICSLHIEPQTQEGHSQNCHGAHANSANGFSDGAAGSIGNSSHGLSPYSLASQPVISCRRDLNCECSASTRTPNQNEQFNSVQCEVNQRHVPSGQSPHLCHSMSDPQSTCSTFQHKLDSSYSQLDSRDLMFMPNTSNNDQQNLAQHSQLMSQQSHTQMNEKSSIHCSIDGSIHNDTSANPYHESMPAYNQEFHLHQLPTGVYEPELGMEENPYYFSVNQMLYEAHLYRVRRENSFPNCL